MSEQKQEKNKTKQSTEKKNKPSSHSGLIALLVMAIAFIAVMLLNLFACPYKLKLKEVVKGSLFTCVFSIVFTVVFLLYLKFFSSYDKIYGKIAVIPIFFIWLFIIMRCLVGGISLNAYFLGRRKRLTNNSKYCKIIKKLKGG